MHSNNGQASKASYFGHALRMESSRLPKIALHGEINKGSRPIGRPKRNHRSCIIEDLKQFNLWDTCNQSSLNDIVSKRKKWRNLIVKGSLAHQSQWENHREKLSEKRKLKSENTHALLVHI